MKAGTLDIHWPAKDPEREEKVLRECDRIVRELVAMGAIKVILFGSRARGEEKGNSDLDILAVVPGAKGPFASRLADYYERLKPRVALDLLVYTPEELELLKERPMIKEALEQGMVLHES